MALPSGLDCFYKAVLGLTCKITFKNMSQAIIIEKKSPSRSKNTANYLFSQDGLFL